MYYIMARKLAFLSLKIKTISSLGSGTNIIKTKDLQKNGLILFFNGISYKSKLGTNE